MFSHHLIVDFSDRLDERAACSFSSVCHFSGNIRMSYGAAGVTWGHDESKARWRKETDLAFEVHRAHVDHVDKAGELVFEADGQSGEGA
jgi:hypothetical protein